MEIKYEIKHFSYRLFYTLWHKSLLYFFPFSQNDDK